MFFWLIAIPFFVIIAMFTLFKLPSNDLKKPEEIQDTAMAFRMVLQHDAAVKLMEDYKADTESTLFDSGSYDMSGDDWKTTLKGSGYLPSNFIPDTDNIVTYVRCLGGSREVTSCRYANGVYVITAAAVPSAGAITSRWFEKVGAGNLATQLEKYAGSFPIKQDGLVLPKKPRKEENETDEAYAIRLNAYNAEKDEYMRLKRRYYNFGEALPRPDTAVGQVRAYPFDGGEEASERVIVRRIRSVEGGTVNYETVSVPVDIPDTEGQPFDFNGEAVIFTASFKQPDACVMVYEAKNISTSTLSSNVQEIGTYTIPVAGNYQIKLMGEAGLKISDPARVISSAGGILISNHQYNNEDIFTIKAIKGGYYPGYSDYLGGAGVALWDDVNTTGAPILVAGGGSWGAAGGGGYNGGKCTWSGATSGYSWDGSLGTNTTYCSSAACNIGATGGRWWSAAHNWGGYGGTGYCGSGYTCTMIAGGNGGDGGASDYTNYPNSSYGNWSADHAYGYASITYCGPEAEDFCSRYTCDTTKTCLIANDCPSNKPYCNNGECSATQILTCDSTDTMATDTWIAGWANCTSCPAGQFKKYKSGGEGGNTNYPITSTGGCVSIPAVNSYTTMPTGAYHVGTGYSTVSNLNVWRRQVNITCNGKNEEWDVIGPYIEWWEAQEICAKLGKTLPADNASLTGGCSEGARRTLIANAIAVGTGQTLKEVNGISTSQYWDSSTGNTTRSAHCIYTNQTNGTNAATVFLVSGTGTYGRSDAYISCSILCGPAQ